MVPSFMFLTQCGEAVDEQNGTLSPLKDQPAIQSASSDAYMFQRLSHVASVPSSKGQDCGLRRRLQGRQEICLCLQGTIDHLVAVLYL